MNYRPEKNRISIYIFIALLLADILLFVLFNRISSLGVKALIIIFFSIVNFVLLFALAYAMTLRYRIDDEFITISGAFGTLERKIPIKSIISFNRSITLLDYSGIKGVRTARFALGRYRTEKNEKADLYITSSRKAILLRTGEGFYGVSPEEVENFSSQLRLHGIEQKIMTEDERVPVISMDSKGRKRTQILFMYTFLVILIFLVVPFLLNFMGLLPKFIQTGILGNSGMYVTRNVHLEQVLMNAFISLFILIVGYLSILNLSTIEGVFYHQLMYLPLLVSIVYLFHEVSTVFNALSH